MSTEIKVHALKSISITGDGSAFRLCVGDQEKREVGLTFPTAAIKSLMINLFRISNATLQRLLNVDRVRLVYPVADVEVESRTDDGSVILVFRTGDEFEIAFAVKPQQLIAAAKATNSEEIQQTRRLRGALN